MFLDVSFEEIQKIQKTKYNKNTLIGNPARAAADEMGGKTTMTEIKEGQGVKSQSLLSCTPLIIILDGKESICGEIRIGCSVISFRFGSRFYLPFSKAIEKFVNAIVSASEAVWRRDAAAVSGPVALCHGRAHNVNFLHYDPLIPTQIMFVNGVAPLAMPRQWRRQHFMY
jgi:hypothetical protein